MYVKDTDTADDSEHNGITFTENIVVEYTVIRFALKRLSDMGLSD